MQSHYIKRLRKFSIFHGSVLVESRSYQLNSLFQLGSGFRCILFSELLFLPMEFELDS